MTNYDYLIIDGGMTAAAAVDGIRKVDPTGGIGMISTEPDAPYNRPPLSKALWKGKPLDSIWRKTEDKGVEMHLGSVVKQIVPSVHGKGRSDFRTVEQIKKFTTVVADTADFESIREFSPQDATTNPSLVYAATQKVKYSHFLKEVLVDRRNSGLAGAAQMEDIIDRLLVRFGSAMLEIVPGRVSTETDARFSFDVKGSIRKAQRLVKLYEEQGIGRERVLIKIASTWEGIMAAEQLQKEGIKCNMTLLFSLPQAVRAAEAKVQLISPFVGRIYDWYKAEKIFMPRKRGSTRDENCDRMNGSPRVGRTPESDLVR